MNPISVDRADGALSAGSESTRVLRILEGYLCQLEQGRQPNRAQLLAAHPDLAELLSEYLASLEVLHRAAVNLPDVASASCGLDQNSSIDAGCTLGDFRLIRELGRGGMGIVYEAEQLSLRRHVALKVLPFAAVLDPKYVQRFKNEAHAAGQLDHPNIVPVHAVGCERGVHYYAMQFIDGHSLAQIADQSKPEFIPLTSHTEFSPFQENERHVNYDGAGDKRYAEDQRSEPNHEQDERNEFPSTTPTLSTQQSHRSAEYFRTVARLGRQAAEALHHAHLAGIVHRDIKPSNLLLDSHGKLWVTDFGLAHVPSDAQLTMTGDVLGTLRYMSPEQAAGQAGLVDHRTDVYSLGVTLYEVLTLTAPFDAEDRHVLLRQIVEDEPPAPSLRNREIPKELETIVATAISKDREDRYPTAAELAADLCRFLEDKPIRAKRATLAERAAKWLRRHRRLVRAVLVLLVLATVAATFSAVRISVEKANTDAALARAENNLLKAREAVDEILNAAEKLDDVPHAQPMRETMLQKALTFYQGFVEQDGLDPSNRYGAAVAHRRCGEIERMRGRLDAAASHHQQAFALAEQLLSRTGFIPLNTSSAKSKTEFIPFTHLSKKYATELAHCLHGLGVVLYDQRRLRDAEEAVLRAVELRETLTAQFPDQVEHTGQLATSVKFLATVTQYLGHYDEAEAIYRRALRIRNQLSQRYPDNADFQIALAASHSSLGTLLHTRGEAAEAAPQYRQSLAVYQDLAARFPARRDYRSSAAQTHSNLGLLLTGKDETLPEAEQQLKQSLQLRVALMEDYPQVPRHGVAVASCYNSLGIICRRNGRFDEAQAYHVKSVELCGQLCDRFPQVRDCRVELAYCHENFWLVCDDSGQNEEAIKHIRDCIVVWTQLSAESPDVFRYRKILADRYQTLGGKHDSLKQYDAAGAAYENALVYLDRLVPDFPNQTEFPPKRVRVCHRLSHVLAASGETQRAAEALARGLHAIDELVLDAIPDGPQSADQARTCNSLAWSLATCVDCAPHAADRAVRLASKAVELRPASGNYWNTMGAAYCCAERWADAIDALERSMEIRTGGDSIDWFLLALAHGQLGNADESRRWHARAVKWMEANDPHNAQLLQFRQKVERNLFRSLHHGPS